VSKSPPAPALLDRNKANALNSLDGQGNGQPLSELSIMGKSLLKYKVGANTSLRQSGAGSKNLW
jgi:hypothetical protein